MHSCTQRFLEITSLALSTYLAGLLLVVCSSYIPVWGRETLPIISTFNMSYSPLLQLPVPQLYAQGRNPPPMHDIIFLTVSMRADFSPVWDWNTKGIYVALVVHYTNNEDVVNEVTIIDAVLDSLEAAKNWHPENMQKYALEDEHLGALAGVRVRVMLRYQTLRHCGYSPIYEMSPKTGSNIIFEVPSTYHKKYSNPSR